jgi:hypothetical protein
LGSLVHGLHSLVALEAAGAFGIGFGLGLINPVAWGKRGAVEGAERD